jgi:wobble nucleotide-excising tRNase
MSQSITQIAQSLKDSPKKVQLIYAFNGTGKTRLSREFKNLISPKEADSEEDKKSKVLYYNAFTEDLFYWDNDLLTDENRKIIIRPNDFTNWVLQDQGQEPNIITNFQYYTNDKLTPRFNDEYTIKDKDNNDVVVKAFSEITFSLEKGNEENIENLKISKGEESNLIWCIFYSLLELIVEVLNVPEPGDRETNDFDNLEYIFIDDPVSSLDDTHLIELAVNIATLVKKSYYNRSENSGLKFIITTHNPLFYNVLFNEFNNPEPSSGYKRKDSERKRLGKLNDGTFTLVNQSDDSPFSYHLYLLSELEKVIDSGEIQKYHFNFLRNILEKTSTFLGYSKWKDLLPEEAEGSREGYYNRIVNLSSHSNHHGDEVAVLEENDKRVLERLVREIKGMYNFKSNIISENELIEEA